LKLQIRKPEFHPGQAEIFDSSARFKVASCGRRFGKTLMAGYWLTLSDQDSAIGGKPVAWCAPTYKLLMEVFDQFERTLKPMIRRTNRTEQRIELVSGGKIDFWTLEDKDAGRGRKYKRMVIDEAAHARYLKDAWEMALSPTLIDLRGEAWFISTPNGQNFFQTLYKRGANPEFIDWAAFQHPSTANPHLPPEYLEARRLELPSLIYQQEHEAQFVTFGGNLIKPDMLIDGAYPKSLPCIMAVDLAISQKEGADFTAIAILGREPTSGMVYIKEVRRGRWSFHETKLEIVRAATEHKPSLVAIEQTQYQAAMVQELTRETRLAVRGIRPDRDKVTRFAPLLTRFEQHQVRLDPDGCKGWLRDELSAFPEGEHDDCVDALAYAWAALSTPGFAFVSDAPKLAPWR
jgi:predicted phage terminase large subunit-like protein